MIFLIVSAILLIMADQLSKYWAVAVLKPLGSLPILPGFIRFFYVENTGAAFSMFEGMRFVLIGFTSVALLVVAWLLFVKRRTDKLEEIALLLIFSGGVGNLIDRVLNGFVVDFFDFQFMTFAVFNVADCCVVVGVGLFALAFILQEVKEKKRKAAAAAQEAPSAGEANDDADH